MGFSLLQIIDPTGGAGSETGGGMAASGVTDAGRRRGGGKNVIGCILRLSM
jgi:hypothetical protein